MKMANVVLDYRKVDKFLINNYRLTSLKWVISKVLELYIINLGHNLYKITWFPILIYQK